MAKPKGFLPIRFSEDGRAALCLVMSITNWVCIVISLSLLGLGLYIKFAVEEYTNLVTNYDGESLPYLLISVGTVSSITNLVGGWIAFISGNPKKRMSLRFAHFGYIIWTLCVSVAVFAGGIMCFTHTNHLRDSFHGGLTAAMSLYKDGEIHKYEIDKLQMSFKCCGNTAYTDWFQIPWIHTDYLDIQSEDQLMTLEAAGGYRGDDAPFSCCSPSSHRPCVHHKVHDNRAHVNYDYREHITLHSMGCRDALMNHFGDTILKNAGAIIFGIFVLQLMVAIVTRYLETSLTEAALSDDPTGPSYGYLINTGSKKESGDDFEKTTLTGEDDDPVYQDPDGPGTPSKSKRRFSQGGSRRQSTASQAYESYNEMFDRRQSMSPGKMTSFSPPGNDRRVSTANAGRRISTGSELRRLGSALARARNNIDANHSSGYLMPESNSPPQAPPPPPPPPPPPMGGAPTTANQDESCSWGSDEWDEYTQ